MANADHAKLARKLGLPIGKTLAALIDLCFRESPASPSSALGSLWFEMPWLDYGQSLDPMVASAPANVRPFATTGNESDDGIVFGFLFDGPPRDTDHMPVVMVFQSDDPDATEIIAPSLTDFLSLLTVGFGDVVSRTASDEQWFALRDKWYGDQPDRLAEMNRLSGLLLTIAGVRIPPSPRALANAHPDQAFFFSYDDHQVFDQADSANRLWVAQKAEAMARALMLEGRYNEALHLARIGLEKRIRSAPCRYILARCLCELGYKRAAHNVARKLAVEWLSATLPPPPETHPRLCLERSELVALLERAARGPDLPELVDAIRKMPEDMESSSSFL